MIEAATSIDMLSWAMDRALASHSVSRINVANANVVGFEPISISFQSQLDTLNAAGRNGSIEQTLGSMKQTVAEMMEMNTSRLPGEKVQVDSEVTQMVKHAGYYQTLADVMSRKMGLMKLAVNGRG
jgi:flagellar basal-body rod protein FlgB